MRNLISAILLALVAPLAACRGNDLGTGANTVDRDYAKPAAEVCKAALQSAEGADFKVLSDRRDQLGGELRVSRGDGREVSFSVKSIDEKSARVSVRVEPGDRDLANLLHERIAGHLGLGVATTGWWSGGSSIESKVDADLAWCMTAARRTLAVLAESAKDEEVHSAWCRIDGRLKGSTPVRIKMEKLEEHRTRVFFIVGTTNTEDHRAFARKMKDEFDRTPRPAAGTR